mgnify:CR=1 FL=1
MGEAVAGYWQCRGKACTLTFLPGGNEALLLVDSCFLPAPDTAAVARPATKDSSPVVVTVPAPPYCPAPVADRYVREGNKWTSADKLPKPAQEPAARARSASGITAGAIEIRKVERRQVFVGGEPVGDPFE